MSIDKKMHCKLKGKFTLTWIQVWVEVGEKFGRPQEKVTKIVCCILKKSGANVVFSSGRSLQSIICAKNKVKLPKKQIVYKAHCPCRPNKNNAYIGQSKRTLSSRLDEHKGYIRRGEWAKSGLAAHKEHCNAPIDWKKVEILSHVTT